MPATTTRRDMFRGVALGAGGYLLNPFLNRLDAHADGKAAVAPKRFVFVLQNNGFQPWAAVPTGWDWSASGPDKPSARPLAGATLPDDLSPLQPHLAKTTIVHRLNGVHSKPYHGGFFGALSGSTEARREPKAQTIDAALGSAQPGIFPMIGLGIDPRGAGVGQSVVYACSAAGPKKPIPTQCRPDLAFRSLFGSVAGDDARKSFDSRTALLDFMRDDARRVSGRLTGEERDKFDAYLKAFETMGDRLAKLKAAEPALKKHAPKPDPRYTSATVADRAHAQFEIATASLIAGLTNVVTICSGLCDPTGHFTGVGADDINIHHIGHGQSDEKGRTSKELYTLLRKFHVARVADLAAALAAVPEGDRTMLDNTLILYTSDSGASHHSDGTDWPFVFVGGSKMGWRPGRYVEYPGYGRKGNRTTNALYCTLLHAAGTPKDHFNLDGNLREIDTPGPLSELLA